MRTPSGVIVTVMTVSLVYVRLVLGRKVPMRGRLGGGMAPCFMSQRSSGYDVMLSIERMKEIFNDPTLSEESVRVIRDEMYIFANVIFDHLTTAKAVVGMETPETKHAIMKQKETEIQK